MREHQRGQQQQLRSLMGMPTDYEYCCCISPSKAPSEEVDDASRASSSDGDNEITLSIIDMDEGQQYVSLYSSIMLPSISNAGTHKY